jgi:single-strand DNA-binding protein
MNPTNHIVLEGNVVRDVEYQLSQNGNGYTRNAIAVERRFKKGDDWESETSFFDFSILDDRLAENFCNSVSKGDRVIIAGDIRQRTVEDDEGNKRSFYGVVVDNVGASLKWATATISKNEKKGNGGSAQGGDFFDDSEF